MKVSMKRTPLYQEHLKLGARMVEFGGWEMPLHYSQGILAEHLATRKFGGLFDISHMGRFRISGQDALPFLQYVLTSNVAALEPGQSHYTIIPNESGGAIDDAYLYRMGEAEYLLVTNAANTEKDWRWLEKHRRRFPRLTLEDHTAGLAMLALQGPRVKAVLATVLGDVSKLPGPLRNTLVLTELFGVKVPIARTGYTGEPLGFELFVPAEVAARLWSELLETGAPEGIVPVGLGARDTLRLEAGLPLYGHELGSDAEGKEVPVFALPIARLATSFSPLKGEFIGREALLKQFQELKLRQQGQLDTPKEKQLVPRTIFPLAISGGVARAGCQVCANGRPVGHVTSGTLVPYWIMEGAGTSAQPGAEWDKRTISLAYLDGDLKEGQRVTVMIRDKPAAGIIVKRHLGSEAAPYARPILAEVPENAILTEREESVENLSRNLVRKAASNTVWRQHQTINLIPSEQTPSPLVRLLTIADPSGRYAEHQRVEALGDVEAYYYQGTRFIAEVEQELRERLKQFLGCSEVETRPISGQMANATVFSGLIAYLNRLDRRAEPRRLRRVMNHHIGRGGHLSAQPMGALRDFVAIDPVTERWAVVNFPVRADNPYQIDLERTAELLARYQPELIIFGKSLILHREPVREIAELAAGMKPRPIILYDAAHVLGLLGPYFQEPLSEGADLITASTHKTFFGTQRGIIASNMSQGTEHFDLWQSIVRRAFPGSVSNHHLGTLLGLLMATYEMNTYGRDYQKQVIANAKAFARALKERGLEVEGDPAVSYTETHQVVLRVGYAKAVEVAEKLERNNIILNYQALPDDEAFTASSGLRTGVQEMTRFGMKEADFAELAEYMAAVILDGKDVAEEVARFRERFTKMQYCLPEEEAKPLVDELIHTLIKS
ncbi:MAG TPA: glycine cleavage system aminomethyltransferase GcvT [Dehalococcoidia bacterium]|nr:glycine cleavage system aminomethyltransferase GcvT [Dehalococcoidia bacterium]